MGITRNEDPDPTAMGHEEFAHRAEGRLLEAADRLEGEARDLGIHGEASKTRARAGELRVAALLVREEAEAVSRSERPPADSRGDPAGAPPLEAQA
jgi:hypothetical protein